MGRRKRYKRSVSELYIESPAAICPFYIQETARSRRIALFCEGAKLKFRTKESRARFELKYCYTHEYKSCAVCNHLFWEYEEKEKQNADKGKGA